MSFTNAQQARLLLHATELAPKLSQVRAGTGSEMLDVTALSDTAKRFIAGLTDGEFSMEGWLDGEGFTATMTALSVLDALGMPAAATYFPQGYTFGRSCVLATGRRASFEEGTEVGGAANFSLALTGDGHVAHGFSIHPLGAETIDGNGTTFDRGVTSTGLGAVAHLHTSAFTGLTSNAVTIEDSANDSAWSTIGSFSSVTATGGQRLEIAGTVRRYVRCSWDVDGSGSTTFAVAFAPL